MEYEIRRIKIALRRSFVDFESEELCYLYSLYGRMGKIH